MKQNSFISHVLGFCFFPDWLLKLTPWGENVESIKPWIVDSFLSNKKASVNWNQQEIISGSSWNILKAFYSLNSCLMHRLNVTEMAVSCMSGCGSIWLCNTVLNACMAPHCLMTPKTAWPIPSDFIWKTKTLRDDSLFPDP